MWSLQRKKKRWISPFLQVWKKVVHIQGRNIFTRHKMRHLKDMDDSKYLHVLKYVSTEGSFKNKIKIQYNPGKWSTSLENSLGAMISTWVVSSEPMTSYKILMFTSWLAEKQQKSSPETLGKPQKRTCYQTKAKGTKMPIPREKRRDVTGTKHPFYLLPVPQESWRKATFPATALGSANAVLLHHTNCFCFSGTSGNHGLCRTRPPNLGVF